MAEPHVLLRVSNLKKYYPIDRGVLRRARKMVKAVDGVSFDVYEGETLGLVGESGCGKSTTGDAILQLERPTAGSVRFKDIELTALKPDALRRMRRDLQMVFQDPYASLNPRLTVGQIIGEPLRNFETQLGKTEREKRIRELLELVGLDPFFINRYPHELSGGQRQRVGIARALALNPTFIVCDEPIAALDVSIQAQIVKLLGRLQRELGLTYLFISHDLSMIRLISDRIAVMYLGRVVELASRDALYEHPRHPYTQALLSAVPIPDPELERNREQIVLEGDVPNPVDPPQGCNFNTRCPVAVERCFVEDPELRQIDRGHWCACHLVEAQGVIAPK